LLFQAQHVTVKFVEIAKVGVPAVVGPVSRHVGCIVERLLKPMNTVSNLEQGNESSKEKTGIGWESAPVRILRVRVRSARATGRVAGRIPGWIQCDLFCDYGSGDHGIGGHRRSDHRRSDHRKSDHRKSDHRRSDHRRSDDGRNDHRRSDHRRSDHGWGDDRRGDDRRGDDRRGDDGRGDDGRDDDERGYLAFPVSGRRIHVEGDQIRPSLTRPRAGHTGWGWWLSLLDFRCRLGALGSLLDFRCRLGALGSLGNLGVLGVLACISLGCHFAVEVAEAL
ncbi:hypothetical protein QBC41DRAFT_395183, partial [Cercophora samala]